MATAYYDWIMLAALKPLLFPKQCWHIVRVPRDQAQPPGQAEAGISCHPSVGAYDELFSLVVCMWVLQTLAGSEVSIGHDKQTTGTSGSDRWGQLQAN